MQILDTLEVQDGKANIFTLFFTHTGIAYKNSLKGCRTVLKTALGVNYFNTMKINVADTCLSVRL